MTRSYDRQASAWTTVCSAEGGWNLLEVYLKPLSGSQCCNSWLWGPAEKGARCPPVSQACFLGRRQDLAKQGEMTAMGLWLLLSLLSSFSKMFITWCYYLMNKKKLYKWVQKTYCLFNNFKSFFINLKGCHFLNNLL